jgi:hypothetical protein
MKSILICPFSFDFGKASDNLQVEWIDLQSDNGLQEKFKSVMCPHFFFFYLLCDSKYNSFKDFGKNMLPIVAFTYNCEQTFSLMKLKNSDLRVQMTDEYLAALLCIATSTLSSNIGKKYHQLKAVPSAGLI